MLTNEEVQEMKLFWGLLDEIGGPSAMTEKELRMARKDVGRLCATVDELRRLVRVQWKCEQVYLDAEEVAAILTAIGEGE